ncbi:MAG TPA: hypothetical protein VGJ90_09280 [Methylophilaceae bacterium]
MSILLSAIGAETAGVFIAALGAGPGVAAIGACATGGSFTIFFDPQADNRLASKIEIIKFFISDLSSLLIN